MALRSNEPHLVFVFYRSTAINSRLCSINYKLC